MRIGRRGRRFRQRKFSETIVVATFTVALYADISYQNALSIGKRSFPISGRTLGSAPTNVKENVGFFEEVATTCHPEALPKDLIPKLLTLVEAL